MLSQYNWHLTVDYFGDHDVPKYYAAFAYNKMPYFSEPALLPNNIED